MVISHFQNVHTEMLTEGYLHQEKSGQSFSSTFDPAETPDSHWFSFEMLKFAAAL